MVRKLFTFSIDLELPKKNEVLIQLSFFLLLLPLSLWWGMLPYLSTHTHTLSIFYSPFMILAAAYQVGLSFLTTHMRRAVAACTSPEVFFVAGASNADAAGGQMHGSSSSTDPLGLAMDALSVSANTV